MSDLNLTEMEARAREALELAAKATEIHKGVRRLCGRRIYAWLKRDTIKILIGHAVPALAADVEALVARCEALEEAARDALDDWDNSSEEGFYGTKDGHKKMAALLKEKP